jgi:hypothetical protein
MKLIDSLITAIAREHLDIKTLETRKHDSLDFHDVSVWGVKDALLAAYHTGQRMAGATQPLSLLQDISLAIREGSMRMPKDWVVRLDRTIAEVTAANLPEDSTMVRFDDYEIHGVKEFGKGARKVCEQVDDDDEAQFWSLYGHIPGQGLDCIGDFKTRKHAEEVYARITGRPYGRKS